MNRKSTLPLSRRSLLKPIGMLAFLLFIQSCANHQVRIPDIDPLEKSYQGGTVYAFFWGFLVNPEIISAECGDEAINDVVVKNNFLFNLTSVVTLGIWMPIEILFRCRAPDIDAGAFPE